MQHFCIQITYWNKEKSVGWEAKQINISLVHMMVELWSWSYSSTQYGGWPLIILHYGGWSLILHYGGGSPDHPTLWHSIHFEGSLPGKSICTYKHGGTTKFFLFLG